MLSLNIFQSGFRRYLNGLQLCKGALSYVFFFSKKENKSVKINVFIQDLGNFQPRFIIFFQMKPYVGLRVTITNVGFINQ